MTLVVNREDASTAVEAVRDRWYHSGDVAANRLRSRFCRRDGVSVDTVLSGQLDDVASAHSEELSEHVPGFAAPLAYRLRDCYGAVSLRRMRSSMSHTAMMDAIARERSWREEAIVARLQPVPPRK